MELPSASEDATAKEGQKQDYTGFRSLCGKTATEAFQGDLEREHRSKENLRADPAVVRRR